MQWDHIVSKVTDIIQLWDTTESITVYVQGKSIYDTGFFVEVTVYCRQPIPWKTVRRKTFDFADLYEHLSDRDQDRLLVHGIPINIRYENIRKLETLMSNRSKLQNNINCLKIFWRIASAHLHFSRDERLENLQQKIEIMPSGFWIKHRRVLNISLRESIRVLRKAVLDDNFYLFSTTSIDFIRSYVSCLFCTSQKFEPPEHIVKDTLDKLPIVTQSIINRIKIFIYDKDISLLQRCEIAELLMQEASIL